MDDGTGRVAVLWDQSFLWGLIAYHTFRGERINFDLCTAADVREGCLEDYHVVFVPGGWAADKIEALGEQGAEEIRRFVADGGSYLGFCGGAGLALTHDSGLGLVPVARMPTGDRLPSFSGNIELYQQDLGHPMWSGIEDNHPFHAWWPGQFSLADEEGIKVLARYGDPDFDSFVTDLPVIEGMDWNRWEDSYGINLNPSRIRGEPAIIESTYGTGRVLLSYIHFETPGDKPGHQVLLNLLAYLSDGRDITGWTGFRGKGTISATVPDIEHSPKAASQALAMAGAALGLYRFGRENLLWFRRRKWLLQWRRGVRGIEYSTLDAILNEISDYGQFAQGFDQQSNREVEKLSELVLSFYRDARELLMLERYAMTNGPLSPLKCDDPEIQRLRENLFSTRKRCGGRYKEIVELADGILLRILRHNLVHT